jgi:hypothetical protein
MEVGDMIKIGDLDANIAGDYRYTDILEVFYVPETNDVHVKVKSSSPGGGRDTLGSELLWTEVVNRKCEAHPKCIIKLIKNIIAGPNLNFKRYGKPSKNFEWITKCHRTNYGLNSTYAGTALDLAKEIASVEHNDLIMGE